EDWDGLPVALAVGGWWDQSAAKHDDPEFFTFACRKGVISKCYRWGYRPWDTRAGAQWGLSGSALHQACTRMARADYCGDGQSWTKTGTLINMWDLDGIQLRGASEPGFHFEAGWTRDGATCLDHKRWSDISDKVFFENCPNLFDQMPGGTYVPRICDSAD